MLNEDWWFPVFLGANYWRLPISAGCDVIITCLPATPVVAGEAFIITAIELMPSLAGSYFLTNFILAIRDCCASGQRKAKCYRTHSSSENRLVPHEVTPFENRYLVSSEVIGCQVDLSWQNHLVSL
jgi:hypothetical protein